LHFNVNDIVTYHIADRDKPIEDNTFEIGLHLPHHSTHLPLSTHRTMAARCAILFGTRKKLKTHFSNVSLSTWSLGDQVKSSAGKHIDE
jgi:hypothetical protein